MGKIQIRFYTQRTQKGPQSQGEGVCGDREVYLVPCSPGQGEVLVSGGLDEEVIPAEATEGGKELTLGQAALSSKGRETPLFASLVTDFCSTPETDFSIMFTH